MKTGSVNKVMLSYTEALGKRGKKKSVNTDPFIFNFEFFLNYIKVFSLLITKFFGTPLNFVHQVSVSLVSPNPSPAQQSKLPLKNPLDCI